MMKKQERTIHNFFVNKLQKLFITKKKPPLKNGSF